MNKRTNKWTNEYKYLKLNKLKRYQRGFFLGEYYQILLKLLKLLRGISKMVHYSLRGLRFYYQHLHQAPHTLLELELPESNATLLPRWARICMRYSTPRHKLMVSPCMMSRELIRNNKHRKSWIRLTCFCSRETMAPQKLNGLIMDSWTERLISCSCIQLNKKEGFMVCCCIKEVGLATLEGAVSVGQ